MGWGEQRVCFCCDRTTGSGALHNNMWFCDKCWAASRERGEQAPKPSSANAALPELKPDDIKEERMEELKSHGMNIDPSRGRHKLTLLRERGYFIPVDPTSE